MFQVTFAVPSEFDLVFVTQPASDSADTRLEELSGELTPPAISPYLADAKIMNWALGNTLQPPSTLLHLRQLIHGFT